MAERKPPRLSLSEGKAASVRIWRRKFNTWCLLQRAWRDTSKCPTTPDHSVAEKAQSETAAFFLALPDDVLEVFDTAIFAKMTTTEKKQPLIYQQRLEVHFVGQENVMPELLAIFNCIQNPDESVTDFETRIRSTAQKSKYF